MKTHNFLDTLEHFEISKTLKHQTIMEQVMEWKLNFLDMFRP